MNISPGELSNVHKRVNYFLLAWGELDFEMMRLLSGKKLKGRLASFFKPSGSSAITDATLQMLSGLWYAEQAHFGLRYHDFATKQSWFKRPKYGSANKHLDSMYTQVIDTLEKILDMVESSVGRDFASRSPIDMASRTERTTKAQAAFERTVAEFMSMLDYVRRIARVRTMLVPIYRSVLANTVPMRDHDIVSIVDPIKSANFNLVPHAYIHKAWYNCIYEIEFLRLSFVAHKAICSYDFVESIVAMRACQHFSDRWISVCSQNVQHVRRPTSSEWRDTVSALKQQPLYKFYLLLQTYRLDKMGLYFHSLWKTEVQGPLAAQVGKSNSREKEQQYLKLAQHAALGRVHSPFPPTRSASHRVGGVIDDAPGRFRHLYNAVQRSELARLIVNFAARCCDEYTNSSSDSNWGDDCPSQGLGSDVAVSVNIVLDAVSLRSDRLSGATVPNHPWHCDGRGAYECPATTWTDQYQRRQRPVADTPIEQRSAAMLLNGIETRYPCMFTHTHGRGHNGDNDVTRQRYWPNITTYIASRDLTAKNAPAWSFDKPFHAYEDQFHTTFFICNPDPHLYFCVVCQSQHRNRKDGMVAEFLEHVGNRLSHNIAIAKRAKNLTTKHNKRLGKK